MLMMWAVLGYQAPDQFPVANNEGGREGGMWECERESVDLGWVPPGHQLGYEMHEDKQCHIHFPHHWVSTVVPAERERECSWEREIADLCILSQRVLLGALHTLS